VFFQGQVPTQSVDGPANAPFVFHLGCALLSGKTGFFFEALGGGRCANRFQHQPSRCPSRALRPITADAEDGGACPPRSDQWRDRVEPSSCPPIFLLDPQLCCGDSDAGQSLLVNRALQRSCAQVFLSTLLVAGSLLDLQVQSTRVRRGGQKNRSKEGQPSKRYLMSVHRRDEMLRQIEQASYIHVVGGLRSSTSPKIRWERCPAWYRRTNVPTTNLRYGESASLRGTNAPPIQHVINVTMETLACVARTDQS